MVAKKPTKPVAKRRSKIKGASANSLRGKRGPSRSSEHLASFPQLNPNPVLEVGAKGKILFQNRAAVEVILEAFGEDGRVFFPEDMGEILAALDEGKEEMLYREVKVNGRLFGENICLTPQFKTIQVYAIDITERRAAEEALRKNTEKFELLAETAGRLLASDDPQGAVNDLCRRVMEHLDCQAFFLYMADPDRKGLRLNAYAGIPEERARDIEWLQNGSAACEAVARDGRPIVAEDILHLPDSRTDLLRSFGIQAYACHPLTAQGKVVGTLSFGTQTRVVFTVDELDLMRAVAGQVAAAMDRNRLLRMARRRADELDAVFSAMNEPVIVYNGEGVPVKVNAAGRAYGLDDRPEELKKLGDPNALIRRLSARHPDGRGLTPDELPCRRALGGETVAGKNFLLRTGDGREIDIRVSASPIVTAGKITGAVAVWNDVTERERWFHELQKAKEELELRVQERTAALREAKTLLENTLASLTSAVFVIDPRTRVIVSCNPAAEEIFGYKEKEMVGRNTEFLHVNRSMYEEFGQKLFAALNEKGVYQTEYQMRRKDGGVFFTENTITEIVSESDERTGVLSVARDISRRKEAQQALWKANQLLERVFSSIDLLVAYMDQEFNFIRVNRAYAEADGRVPEFYVGQNHFALFPNPENEKIFRQVVETGEPYVALEKPFEYTDHPEQGISYWDWSLHPIREEDGQTSGVVLSLINVTKRKRAEEGVKTAAAYTRSLIEASLDPLVTISAQGKITDVNRATELVTGIGRENLIGSDFSDYFSEPEKAREGYRQVFLKGSVRDYPLSLRHASGHVTEVLYNATVYKNEAGATQGVFAAARDITERKIAEQERLRLAAALEQTAEGILITDVRRSILYVNPAFEVLHGLARQEVLGKRYDDILNIGISDAELQSRMNEALNQGVLWNGRLSGRKRDGNPYEMDVTISPMRDPSGKIINYSIIERDVTEEVKLQQHIRKAEKMEALGILAGGIAHDFNNLLMSMVVNTELVLMDTPEGTVAQQVLRDVLKAARVGQALVKQITAYSRPAEREWHSVSITPVLKETLKLIAHSIPGNIEIRTNVEGSVRMAKVNPAQIHQVLVNLCNNAVYAMRETGGILEVSLADVEVGAEKAALPLDLRPGPYLRLTVRDTGHGMGRALQEKIFDPFFTTKRPGEGTGMGLAVVHGIVQGYKGAVSVESQPGLGATFHVYLPSTPVHEAAPSPQMKVAHGKNEGLLLVDDDELVLRGLKTALEKVGYRVTATTRSREALEIFRARPRDFDLVLTDQSMPDLTGMELAGEILKIRPDLPVILFTGFSEGVGEKEAKEAGIREFVEKPIHTAEIAEVIRKILDDNDRRPRTADRSKKMEH